MFDLFGIGLPVSLLLEVPKEPKRTEKEGCETFSDLPMMVEHCHKKFVLCGRDAL